MRRLRPRRLRAALLALLLAPSLPAFAANEDLPLPRFASLRSNEVNLRTGPGTNYPVDWVLTRRAMPVEVLAEFDIWRKIRDWQGTVGWVHQSMLTGNRTALILASPRLLRSDPGGAARPVVRLEPGVIAIYSVAVKDAPAQLRFFEIYKDEAAYRRHLESAHFKKYAETTRGMIKSKKLIETVPIFLGSRPSAVP